MGVWYFRLLSCLGLVITVQAQDCQNPAPIANMRLRQAFLPPFYEGFQLVLVCDVGYRSAGGSPFITCTAGRWTPVQLRCENVECKEPDIAFAERIGGSGPPHRYKSEVTYQCRSGYKMHGARTLVCDLSGQWSPGLPKCESCDWPGDLEHGHIDYPNGFFFGEKIGFTCDNGLIGNREAVCGDQGWTSRLPVCEVQTCDPPSVIEDGTFSPSKEIYEYGEVVQYSCQEDFTLNGSKSILCSDDGTFKPAPPTCSINFLLQCVPRFIMTHIGDELLVTCKYDTTRFLHSKKYWCSGESRSTCEILVDSEGHAKTRKRNRYEIRDAGRRGLFVKVTDLQSDDNGVYCVGIDRVYSDIKIGITVVVTKVPVSKPRLWSLSSLADRPTCWGKAVTVRCGCTNGTAVRYSWYQNTHHKDVLLQHSSDLLLHCGTEDKDSYYYCIATNDISSQKSDILSVQVVMPANSSCIYIINVPGQPIYDCADRMKTTTVKTPLLSTCQATMKIAFDAGNNETEEDLFFSRAWTEVPLWYTLLRWGSFVSLMMFLVLVLKCTKKERPKRVKRKRGARFK